MNATTTTTADKPKPTKIQEKRAMLIELSQEAKAMRQEFINSSQTPTEVAFWASRTINYMLLNHIYGSEGVRFETFKEWKAQGATIKKGAKATVIWGQPRQAVPSLADKLKANPNEMPIDDIEQNEYEFYPLCFLFSEDDVYFTSVEPETEQPTTSAENDVPIEQISIKEIL